MSTVFLFFKHPFLLVSRPLPAKRLSAPQTALTFPPAPRIVVTEYRGSFLMNIAFFLKPKHEVAFLYEHQTLRQGLEKLRRHGYSAIPVLTRESKYAGTVSEGDFLRYLLDHPVDGDSPPQRASRLGRRCAPTPPKTRPCASRSRSRSCCCAPCIRTSSPSWTTMTPSSASSRGRTSCPISTGNSSCRRANRQREPKVRKRGHSHTALRQQHPAERGFPKDIRRQRKKEVPHPCDTSFYCLLPCFMAFRRRPRL